MEHVTLTCRHHPELRWHCKEIAFTDEGGYNGSRNIFFYGRADGTFTDECQCPARDLIRASEPLFK